MLSAELLKHANENFMLVFTKLFNKILQSGKFPEEWSVGIIVVLFKGGDKADLNNYRGITQARRQLNWNGGAWIASINCCQNCCQTKLRL